MKKSKDKKTSKPFVVTGEEKEVYSPFGEYIGSSRVDMICQTFYAPHPYACNLKKKDVILEYKYYMNNVEVTPWGETVH